MDAKQYIKNKIQEYDSSIDTSDGSPFGDLFINPLSIILQEGFDFEDHMLNNLSIKDPENMTEEELDAIAANYLISRNVGSKAAGNIRLYYNLPTSVSIPAGTVFSNGAGFTYVTSNKYDITKQLMTLNNENFPLYHSGDIAIVGSAEGEAYISRANTITTLISSLDPIPASVRNPIAISAGTDKETNTALKIKILRSVNNQSVASPDGIKRVLQDTYPTITTLSIRGNGDTEMIRDITYSGVEVDNFYESNFDAKISGLFSYPYNESVAYTGRFKDTDTSEVVELPDPDGFTFEFTNEMYKGLYKRDDALYAELGVYNVLEENFNNLDTSTGFHKNWVSSDGTTGKGILVDPNEISVDGQTLKFGVNETDNADGTVNPTGATVTINADNYNLLLQQLNNLEETI